MLDPGVAVVDYKIQCIWYIAEDLLNSTVREYKKLVTFTEAQGAG